MSWHGGLGGLFYSLKKKHEPEFLAYCGNVLSKGISTLLFWRIIYIFMGVEGDGLEDDSNTGLWLYNGKKLTMHATWGKGILAETLVPRPLSHQRCYQFRAAPPAPLCCPRGVFCSSSWLHGSQHDVTLDFCWTDAGLIHTQIDPAEPLHLHSLSS